MWDFSIAISWPRRKQGSWPKPPARRGGWYLTGKFDAIDLRRYRPYFSFITAAGIPCGVFDSGSMNAPRPLIISALVWG